MGMYALNVCLCEVCHHAWLSLQRPARCAKCKSTKWNEASVPTEQVESYPPEPEITSEQAEEFIVDLQPKRSQSAPKVQPIIKERTRTPIPKRKEKKEQPAGKGKYCPHKFIRLDDGTTACKQCNGA
jgi:hypothetical protein